MPGRVTPQRRSFLLPPPCWMKYSSMLSQSILVRQKMMAWSILCSLMALTVYSPFSTLMASDHISKKAKRTHLCFRVHRGNDLFRSKRPLISSHLQNWLRIWCCLWRGLHPSVQNKTGGETKMTFLSLFYLGNAFLILKHLTAVAIQFCRICIIQ